MKKILAGIIALTTVFCTFTGCGSTEDEKADGNDTSVETTAENVENETAVSEKEDAKDDEKPDKKDDKNSDEGYETVIKEFIDAINAGDYEKVFDLQMPEGGRDILRLTLMAQAKEMGKEDQDIDAMLEEQMKRLSDNLPKMKLNKIVSAEDLSDGNIESIKGICAGYKVVIDYINEKGGIDKVNIEEMQKEFEDLDPEDFVDQINIKDAKMVTIEVETEGNEEPSEEEFYVYNIEGQGWRIDNSMLKYLNRSKKTSANSATSSLYKAAMTALVEMDEEDKLPKLKGALVCSDDSKNINVPDDFDTELFKKKVNNYFNDEEELDWFVILDMGCASYAVSVKKGKTESGVYPIRKFLDENLELIDDESVEKKSYDELYDMCAELLK